VREGFQGAATTLFRFEGQIYAGFNDGCFARLNNTAIHVISREGKKNSASPCLFGVAGKLIGICADDQIKVIGHSQLKTPKGFSISLATKFGDKLLLVSNKEKSLIALDVSKNSAEQISRFSSACTAIAATKDFVALAFEPQNVSLVPKFEIEVHENGAVSRIETDHQHPISAVSFSGDGRTLASACCGGRVALYKHSGDGWSKVAGCEHWTYHKSKVTCLEFFGQSLFSGGLDKQICEWRESEGLVRRRRDAHRDGVSALLPLGGDFLCVSAGGDRICKFWRDVDFS
jgi:WD40 repeat protein